MTQKAVERVIGRLVTDEAFRRRFTRQPETTLRETVCCGAELSACELQALARIDPDSLERFAGVIDPRLQKTDIQGGLH